MKRSKSALWFMRSFSMLTLIFFLNTIVSPSVAWALSDSPFQREYASYENGTTDLVNLLTGNLVYAIPIISVPSPEGGFPITLSYHSGITPEEDASWVGLGWNINLGSVNRSVSVYPDDFKGETSYTSMKDPGFYGSSYSWFGWLKFGWDSRYGTGSWGLVNLGIMSFGWGSQAGFEALGVSIDPYGDVSVDAVSFGMAVISIALAIPSGGVSVATQLAMDAAIGIAAAVVVEAISVLTAPAGKSVNMNHWNVTYPSKKLVGKSEYGAYLNATLQEELFGAIYLGDLPTQPFSYKGPVVHYGTGTYTNNTAFPGPFDLNTADLFSDYHTNYDAAAILLHPLMGGQDFSGSWPWLYNPSTAKRPASDMHMAMRGSSVYDNNAPSHISYDYYRVNGPGVSGNIRPYRNDMGSLALSTTVGNVQRYNLIKFDKFEDYPVQFEYTGAASNYYSYHISGNDITNPAYGMGYSNFGNTYAGILGARVDLQLDELYLPNKRRQADRAGLKAGHMEGARFVKWRRGTEKNTTKSDVTHVHTNDGNIIGQYEITSADGTVYIYGEPVHNLFERSYSGTTDGSIKGDRWISDAYGVHWLLTEIHYSDYYDNNNNDVADAGDFGGWVKLNYSKFSDDYQYRFPYTNNDFIYPPDGKLDHYSYSGGKRELVYLESIQTRTHIAIFIKDIRWDGRGYYDASLPLAQSKPTSSLMLKEIVLLTNEKYNEMMSSSNPLDPGTGLGASNYPQLINGEKIENSYDLGDITTNVRSFLNTNQVQKIEFNYEDGSINPDGSPVNTECLCHKTVNSFDIINGDAPRFSDTMDKYDNKKCKLTLRSISTKVQGDKKYMPDYDFYYSDKNPNYDEDKWDKWGMYYSDGLHFHNRHDYIASKETNREEDYWHLKTIVSPTGSKIDINYERDSYSQVADVGVIKDIKVTDYIPGTKHFKFNTESDYIDQIKVGDDVFINASMNYTVNSIPDEYQFVTISTVKSVTKTTPYSGQIELNHFPNFSGTYTSMNAALLYWNPKEIDGGDVRVSKVIASNELGQSFVTKYEYELFSNPGTTSGVVSKEPEWSKNHKYDFEEKFDYPSTGVYYKNVSVLSNYNEANGSYEMRKEFEFQTIEKNMVVEESIPITNPSGWYAEQGSQVSPGGPNHYTNWHYTKSNFHITNDLSSMGRVNAMRDYTGKGHLINQTIYNYKNREDYLSETKNLADPSHNGNLYVDSFPGLRTEGSFVTHQTKGPDNVKGVNTNWRFHFYRTTKVEFPNILESTQIMKNGYEYTLRNVEYDYYTGIILKQEYANSLGYKYLTEVIPAYKASGPNYDLLASKIYDTVNNKNMLTAAAINNLYVDHKGNPELLNSVATTWNREWGSITHKPWRMQGQYVWKNIINKDGTYIPSASSLPGAYVDFNHGTPFSNNGWEVIFENTKFNNYSVAVETRTAGYNHYSALRKDNKEVNIIGTAANSRYGEFTHSGAESNINAQGYYDGDVTLGVPAYRSPEISTPSVIPHTGNYMYSVPYTGKIYLVMNIGDIYNPINEKSIYTLSLWQHNYNFSQSNKPTVKVTYHSGNWDPSENIVKNVVSNSVTKTLSVPNCGDQRFGDWHLLTLEEILGSDALKRDLTKIEIEIENPGTGTIYFDDIRFQPIDASVQAMVTDPETNLTTAVLNNDNVATKMEYFTDEDFKVRKLKYVFKEVIDKTTPGDGGFKKIASKDYNVLDH
ncbi:MAG: hypothetical protein RIE58_07850 [Vicingaceae bacterium]